MGKLADRLRPWVAANESEKQALEIDISLTQGQLQGWIDTQKGRALVIKPGSFNGKDLLLGWIQHLCLSLSDAPGDTLLFDAKQSLRLPKLLADEARPKLAALVARLGAGDEAAAAVSPTPPGSGSGRSRRIPTSRRRPTRRPSPVSTAAG